MVRERFSVSSGEPGSSCLLRNVIFFARAYTLHSTFATEHASPGGSGHDDHGNGFLLFKGVLQCTINKGYGGLPDLFGEDNQSNHDGNFVNNPGCACSDLCLLRLGSVVVACSVGCRSLS